MLKHVHVHNASMYAVYFDAIYTRQISSGANEDGSYTEKKVRWFTQVMQAGHPVFHVHCSRVWFDRTYL